MSKPQEPHEGSRGHRDDAFKDKVFDCLLLRVCECVIIKKNNILATPRFPPVPRLQMGELSAHVIFMATLPPCRPSWPPTAFWMGGGERGGQLVARLPIPLSSCLSSFSSSSCSSSSSLSSSSSSSCFFPSPTPFLFTPLSDVPLHVQGQVVWPRETPTERNAEILHEENTS